jgi:hypothetical protein
MGIDCGTGRLSTTSFLGSSVLAGKAPYKFKKSYGGDFVWEVPIVSILGTVKPTIYL